ncbi:unnamed protein product [Citrullus colocynthis]|uniref:Longin domain-containing protein n=1 Tax=Citrullus colocynthis TaxID=252529 RepID=A0ABP0ZBV6_9ROSI
MPLMHLRTSRNAHCVPSACLRLPLVPLWLSDCAPPRDMLACRATNVPARPVGASSTLWSRGWCVRLHTCGQSRFIYTCDARTFNYLLNNGFTYCAVAVEAAGRQIPMACLERIKEDFDKRYSGGKATIAVAKSLNKEFGPKMKNHMQYCVDHPEESSKLMQVKAQK